MSTTAEFWTWLGQLESRLPLTRDSLEAFFGITFASKRDHNRQPVLVATTDRYDLALRPAKDAFEGELTVRFIAPLMLDSAAIYTRFPGGHSVPPPPPGIGPPDLEGAYIAKRPWGQIWFTLFRGGRLTQISLSAGRFHSPGV